MCLASLSHMLSHLMDIVDQICLYHGYKTHKRMYRLCIWQGWMSTIVGVVHPVTPKKKKKKAARPHHFLAGKA